MENNKQTNHKKLMPLLFLLIVGVLFAITFFTYKHYTEKSNTLAEAVEPGEIKIYASFYPLAFFAQTIADDLAVVNLAKSADVHEYRLSPQEIKDLYTASLVIYQGNLEPWASDLIPQLEKKGISTLAAASNIDKIKLEDEREGGDEHEDEHGHEDEHDHGEFDPHVWLDPVLAKDLAKNIYNAIAKIKGLPENQVVAYGNNLRRLETRLDALNKRYQEQLSSCKQKEVIVAHDAYQYLAERYGFSLLPIAGISTLDTPSAKSLKKLKELATEHKLSYLLAEENSSQEFADTLAREANLKVLAINPLGRGALSKEKDYFNIMEENLNNLTTALACK